MPGVNLDEIQTWIDRVQIRVVIEEWPMWRENPNWEKLRACYTPDGKMETAASTGSADDFVRFSQALEDKRTVRPYHLLSGSAIEVNGDRGFSQTRGVVMVRGVVEGVEADLTAYGRSFDFFERRKGRWQIKERRGIYDWDRLDPVLPGARIEVDPAKLASYPRSYRFLCYFNECNGVPQNLNLTLPGGEGEAELFRRGAAWLKDGVL